MAEVDILERRVSELLDDIAARTSAPAGGSVAAVVVAMAAGLAEMAARFSDGHWAGAEDAAARAAALRERAAPLAEADADAYAAVLGALRLPRATGAERDQAIAGALGDAAAVPLEVAAIGAEVARLAADVAEQGNPNLRGDALAAAALAAAGARVAAALVAINLAGEEGDEPLDERVEGARRLAETASEAAARAAGMRAGATPCSSDHKR